MFFFLQIRIPLLFVRFDRNPVFESQARHQLAKALFVVGCRGLVHQLPTITRSVGSKDKRAFTTFASEAGDHAI